MVALENGQFPTTWQESELMFRNMGCCIIMQLQKVSVTL